MHQKLNKPVTVITCGAGSRGNAYGGFALAYPNQLDIIGVTEPLAIRNERYSKKHNIADAILFNTWKVVLRNQNLLMR